MQQMGTANVCILARLDTCEVMRINTIFPYSLSSSLVLFLSLSFALRVPADVCIYIYTHSPPWFGGLGACSAYCLPPSPRSTHTTVKVFPPFYSREITVTNAPSRRMECGRAETLATRDRPAVRDNVLNDAFLLMTRALLQSQSASPASTKREVYLTLSAAFTEAAARQQKTSPLRLSEGDVTLLLDFCLRQLVEVAGGDGLPMQAATSLAHFVRWAPLVALARFRAWAAASSARTHLLRGAALGEVVDLAHILDQRQGLPRAPMGTIHVAHLAALAAALTPHRAVSDLVSCVARALQACVTTTIAADAPHDVLVSLAHALMAAVCSAWASLETRPAVSAALNHLAAQAFTQATTLEDLAVAALQDKALAGAATDPKLTREPPPPQPPASSLKGEKPSAELTQSTREPLPEPDAPVESADSQFWRDLVS